jgi:hypothetical protein
MVAVRMRDHGARYRRPRVNMKISGLAKETAIGRAQHFEQ